MRLIDTIQLEATRAALAGEAFDAVPLLRLSPQITGLTRGLARHEPALVVQLAEARDSRRDLTLVWERWAIWMLSDPQHGVLARELTEPVRRAVEDVAELFHRSLVAPVTTSEWLAARAGARAGARAAWAAAWAAEAAARAAEAAARAEAEAARAAWRRSAAEQLVALVHPLSTRNGGDPSLR